MPPRLAAAADPGRGELLLSSTDVAADLSLLLSWALQYRVDVSGREVGVPSLEDAYLALTGPAHGTSVEDEKLPPERGGIVGEVRAAGRRPGRAVMIVGQVGYQVRLLTRTPRALWLAIFAPAGLLALRLGRIGHPRGSLTASSPGS